MIILSIVYHERKFKIHKTAIITIDSSNICVSKLVKACDNVCRFLRSYDVRDYKRQPQKSLSIKPLLPASNGPCRDKASTQKLYSRLRNGCTSREALLYDIFSVVKSNYLSTFNWTY